MKDRFLGLLLTLGAAFLAWTTQAISFVPMTDDPGPKLFPFFGCAILALCGISLLLKPETEAQPAPFDLAGLKRILLGFTPLVAYALLLWLVGFLYATPPILLWLYAMMARPGSFRWLPALIYIGLTTAGVFFFFRDVLGSYLPEGLFF
ncbi:tripartite tricarboxylate transporter TctB family protein [Cereibacter sphaeroides]|nr:tripartite tricarboxylate transporter TctB family protein [Cereibacter sphaeroides]